MSRFFKRTSRFRSFSILSAAVFCTSCASKPFVWYEEAQQDDGSIVIVKTLETRVSQTGLAAGANMTGYRFIQIEFDNPVTGQHISWTPRGIPPLNPLAVHFDKDVPYVFGYPYTFALEQYGCPVPPYVIFKGTGRGWTRVMPQEIPQRFSRVNLLTSSGERIFRDGESMYVQDEMLVKASSLDKSKRKALNAIDQYTFRLQYDDVGALGNACPNTRNVSTKYDKIELSTTNDK